MTKPIGRSWILVTPIEQESWRRYVYTRLSSFLHLAVDVARYSGVLIRWLEPVMCSIMSLRASALPIFKPEQAGQKITHAVAAQ
ncbi:protein of unknown function (plasmid) [Shinella sp. WSC3-e]|nr:protein of unknown function [Shinella sp. WSC3-e]